MGGLSKGAIYHHFKSKEDILVAVTDRMMAEFNQMLALIRDPSNLIGKVIAVILTVSMCAQPLGNALYGVLFELCKGFEYVVVLFSGVVSLVIAIMMHYYIICSVL